MRRLSMMLMTSASWRFFLVDHHWILLIMASTFAGFPQAMPFSFQDLSFSGDPAEKAGPRPGQGRAVQ